LVFASVWFWQGLPMTFVVLNTNDLLRFFVDINMPGFRKDMVRVYQGIQQGDVGVIAQAVQAAVAPSAGQQALQAGEAVPSLGVPSVDMGFVTDLRTYMESQAVFSTDMRNHWESQAVVNGAVGGMALKVIDVVKMQETQATTMAQVQAAQARQETAQAQVQAAQARQETAQARQEAAQARQEAAQARQEADMAQMQVEMQALKRARLNPVVAVSDAPPSVGVAAAPAARAAPAAPVVPVVAVVMERKTQKIPQEAKVIAYQWLVTHIKHPYPTHAEFEQLELRVECSIDTTLRMQNLMVATRHKCLVKGEKRRVGPFMRTTWTLPQKNWTQTEPGRWLRE
jgi:hypothetical protein